MSIKETPIGSKKTNTETITSHKLTITILIRSFCAYREDGNLIYLFLVIYFICCKIIDEFKLMDDEVLRCKYRRDFCVLILRLLQSPDLPLFDFRNLLTTEKYAIPNTVLDTFDQTLIHLHTHGVSKLLEIVDSLEKLLSYSDNTMNDSSKSFLRNGCSSIAKTSIVGRNKQIVRFSS